MNWEIFRWVLLGIHCGLTAFNLRMLWRVKRERETIEKVETRVRKILDPKMYHVPLSEMYAAYERQMGRAPEIYPPKH